MIDEKRLLDELTKCKDLGRKSFESVLRVINEQPKVGEWIPCSERLPQGCDDAEIEVVVSLYEPYSETVIRESGFALFYPKSNTFRSVYGERLDITDIVVAWMPLPPAYKEER